MKMMFIAPADKLESIWKVGLEERVDLLIFF